MKKLIFILPFILFSCVTQRACLDKFPPDTITVTEYRDTLLPVYIIGQDTVWKFGTIRDTIRVDNGTAHTIVIVRRDTIKVALWQSDSTYIVRLDSAIKVIKIREQYIKEVTKRGFMDNLKVVIFGILGIFVIVLIIKIIRQ